MPEVYKKILKKNNAWNIRRLVDELFFLGNQQTKVLYINVTLVVEMKDKEFTSHKANYALQFGTNIFMVGLSLAFKS